jgi:murein DD-endopeptidase MepM/ murein hydrolase activator NlpD
VGSEVNQLLNATTQLTTGMQVTAHQNDQAQKARETHDAQKRVLQQQQAAQKLAFQQYQQSLVSSLPANQPGASQAIPTGGGASATQAVMPRSASMPVTQLPASPAPAPTMPASENVSTVDGIKNFVSDAFERFKQLTVSTAQSVAQVVTGAPAQAGTLPPNAVATASPLPTMMNGSPNGGGLIHPLAGKGQISSPFGPRGGRNHNGIDLAAAQGTPVVAAQGGTVTVNDFDANGYGNWVAIRHPDGSETRYGHLVGKSPIAEGTQVTQGQVIGQVGSTGRSTGPHLHYEVRIGGKPKDPMAFLPKGDTQKA